MDLERLEGLKKYSKYIILLALILAILIIIKSCGNGYNKVENAVKEKALEYITKNNLNVVGEAYIELDLLGEIEGVELCSKASGAIVSSESGKIKVEPYLKCDNYETKLINNKEKYASLNGKEVIILNKGETFNDPLYTLKKDAEVEVVGEVGTRPGIYTIKYYVYIDEKLKETLERKVIVSSFDKTLTVSGITDLENPTITLLGDITMNLSVGEKYKEPGYKAVDYKDGKISRNVKVEPSKVNTSRVGTIPITYTVTNSRGKSTSVTRYLNIVSKKSNLNITLSNESNEITNNASIKIIVSGTDFKNMILPNGEVWYGNTYIYNNVNYNGIYKFRVYDIYNNLYEEQIEINNIDKIAPTGTCRATVTNTITNVTVEANDNKGISAYSYILNGNATEFIKENQYEINTKAEDVSVMVKDIAGNVGKIKCDLEKSKLGNYEVSETCEPMDVNIEITTCFGGHTIKENVPLEEYLLGVIHGEGNSTNPEFLKAFLIFARTYTLNRIGYGSKNSYSIRSCSSDQNWCDATLGCYREQTQAMFNNCINYALKYGQENYTAKTCAERATAFPGTKNVSQVTLYVDNASWPRERGMQAQATQNKSPWLGPVDSQTKALYMQMINETKGLVLKTSDGKRANINYLECGGYTNNSTMCVHQANELAKQGYNAGEIIAAFSKKYQNAKIACYK